MISNKLETDGAISNRIAYQIRKDVDFVYDKNFIVDVHR